MMVARWAALLLSLALLAGATGAAAQEETGAPDASGTGDGSGTSPAEVGGNATDATAPDTPTNGTAPQGSDGSAEQGNATDGSDPSADPAGAEENATVLPPYDGTHVHFTIDSKGIGNYSVDGRPLFARITFNPALQPTAAKEDGADVTIEGRGGDFQAVDTPDGHFRAEPLDGQVALRIDERMAIAAPASDKDRADGRFTLLDRNGLVGFVVGADLSLAENDTVLQGSAASFLLHVPEAHTERPPAITQAVDTGQIGAQVLVEQKGDIIEAAPITTGRVNLTVTGKEGHVFATVDGQGNGTALLFTVGHGILEGTVVVRYDGLDIRQAADLADVLDARPDEPAEYLVLVGANVTQVLVSVPHFSTHVIELSSGPVEVILPLLTSGSPWAFAVAAALAVAFVVGSSRLRSRQR